MHLLASLLTDMAQVMIHVRSINGWCQQGRRLAGARIDGSEDIDPFILGLFDGGGSRAFFGPDLRQRSLLSDADFVLEPDLDFLGRVLVLECVDKKGALLSHCCIFSGSFL